MKFVFFVIFEKISCELAFNGAWCDYIVLMKHFIALRLQANYSPYNHNLYISRMLNRPTVHVNVNLEEDVLLNPFVAKTNGLKSTNCQYY